ncbi:hypothetical protein LXA43DRAFT_1056433 [Ganoderma leucocontextum]|nr:hypothetical protein LXA43DRAFT_1056433 [Ganoderma leucocontextum]
MVEITRENTQPYARSPLRPKSSAFSSYEGTEKLDQAPQASSSGVFSSSSYWQSTENVGAASCVSPDLSSDQHARKASAVPRGVLGIKRLPKVPVQMPFPTLQITGPVSADDYEGAESNGSENATNCYREDKTALVASYLVVLYALERLSCGYLADSAERTSVSSAPLLEFSVGEAISMSSATVGRSDAIVTAADNREGA